MKAFHISPKKNRKKILNEGLKPTLGPRSKRFGEREPKLFLTQNIKDSIDLINIRFFNSHPDFIDGIDIWEVNIIEPFDVNKDERFPRGFYIKEETKVENIKLKKSFKWVE
jgi:hypothetical protein